MAKKRKVKDEQERGFTFPEFDRDEYLRKERRDAKITVVTLGYAFLFGLFSYSVALYGEGGIALGLVIGFFGMFTLRRFHGLAGVPVDELETKHLIGYSLLFLLTWLAVWVVLSNPPATDISDPFVETVEVREEDNGTWVVVNQSRTDVEYRVYAKVYDYGELDTVYLVVIRGTSRRNYTMVEDPDSEHWFYATGVTFTYTGTWDLVITAEDTAGNVKEHTQRIRVY